MSYLLDIALVNISLDHVLHIHVSRLLNGTRFRSKQPSKQRMKRVGSKQRAYLGMERSLKRSFNTPIKDYLCKGRALLVLLQKELQCFGDARATLVSFGARKLRANIRYYYRVSQQVLVNIPKLS